MVCNNDALMNIITNKKLDKNVQLFLTVMKDLPDCKKIRANKYMKIVDSTGAEVSTTPYYNSSQRPENLFECDREGCVTSGTLYPQNVDAHVVYRVPHDAVEFAGGLITFYVNGFTGDKTVTFKISSTEDFTNADVYTKTVTGKGDTYVPVVIELTSAPSSEQGTGWEASRNGAYISINVADANAGISTIDIYDSIDDFNTSDVVVVGCLSEIDAPEEFEIGESTCNSSGYDDSADNTVDLTITGNQVSPNYYKLNPRYGRGTATTGAIAKPTTATVQAQGDYGVITLPDMNEATCGFLGAQIADACNATDAQLERLTIPTLVTLGEKQFNAIPNADGSTTLYFNKALVGKKMLITYPQIAEDVTERLYSDDNLGSVRVRAQEVIRQSDGVQIVRFYDNALVSGFPHTINQDETEFSFTLSVQRDARGLKYREYVIGQ